MQETGRQRDVTQRYYVSVRSVQLCQVSVPRCGFVFCLAGGSTGIFRFFVFVLFISAPPFAFPCRGQGPESKCKVRLEPSCVTDDRLDARKAFDVYKNICQDMQTSEFTGIKRKGEKEITRSHKPDQYEMHPPPRTPPKKPENH